MKTYEFPLKVASDGRLEVPGDVSAQLASIADGRVVVIVPESGEAADEPWARLCLEQLSTAYGPEDSVYDDDDGLAPSAR